MGTDTTKTFIGRNRELTRLTAILDKAVDGNGQFALLTGEAGIGKTRLVKELAAIATNKNATILTGHSREISGAPPYLPWIQILTSLLDENDPRLANLKATEATDLSANISDSARFQLFESISNALQRAAQTSPLFITLENIHWADPASLQLLEFLAFDISSHPIMIVGTSRDTKTSSSSHTSMLMGSLPSDQNFTHLPLSELSHAEIASLIQISTKQKPPTVLVDAVQAQSQGNALFATEAINLLKQTGELSKENLADKTDWQIGIPEQTGGVLVKRLAQIKPTTLELLKVAAVLGREFNASQLATVAGKSSVDVLNSLTEPIDVGILAEDHSTSSEFRFSHALFRQVLLNDLSPTLRIELHASAAHAIESSPDSSSETNSGTLAHHYTEAIPLVGKDAAIFHTIKAGNNALNLNAYENAEQWFTQALDLLSDRTESDEWAEASAGIARTLQFISTGSNRQAIGPHLQNAWDYYVSNGRLDEAVELAAIPLSGGESSKLIHLKLVERTIEFADEQSNIFGYLLNNLAKGLLFHTGNFKAAEEHLQNALKIAESYRDHNLKSTVLRSIVENRHFHGDRSEEDAKLLENAMESARIANNPGAEADCARGAIYLALNRGDTKAAMRIGKRGVASAERSHQLNSLVYNLAGLAAAHEANADWEGFFAAVDRSLEIDPDNSAVLSEKIRGLEWLGRSNESDENLIRLAEISNRHAEHFDSINFAMALAWSIDRKPENLAEALSSAERESLRTDVPRRVITQANMVIGWIGCESNSSALVTKAIAHIQENLEIVNGDPVTEVHYGRCLTMVGRQDEGIELIDRHYQHFASSQLPTHTAIVGIWLAKALIKRGTNEDLTRATNLLSTTEEIIREARLYGLTIRVTSARKLLTEAAAKSSRADRLTKRELEILTLVASGMSNPEIATQLFISRHTVVSHLKNVFEKINVENRTQATAYAVENHIT